MKPHKWAKEIKAWADGAEIESRCCLLTDSKWENVIYNPKWDDTKYEYRIKPQPKPDAYLYVYFNAGMVSVYEKELEGWNDVCLGKIKLEQE